MLQSIVKIHVELWVEEGLWSTDNALEHDSRWERRLHQLLFVYNVNSDVAFQGVWCEGDSSDWLVFRTVAFWFFFLIIWQSFKDYVFSFFFLCVILPISPYFSGRRLFPQFNLLFLFLLLACRFLFYFLFLYFVILLLLFLRPLFNSVVFSLFFVKTKNT